MSPVISSLPDSAGLVKLRCGAHPVFEHKAEPLRAVACPEDDRHGLCGGGGSLMMDGRGFGPHVSDHRPHDPGGSCDDAEQPATDLPSRHVRFPSDAFSSGSFHR